MGFFRTLVHFPGKINTAHHAALHARMQLIIDKSTAIAMKSSQAGRPLGSSGDDGEQVVAEGVAEVRREVLNGALASDVCLDEETQHGEHG